MSGGNNLPGQSLAQIAKAGLLRRSAVGLTVVASIALLAGAKSPAPVAVQPQVARTRPVMAAVISRPTTLNPHLHLAAVAATTKSKKKHHHSGHKHAWTSRWSYYAWVGSHRGLGTVQGVVRDKSGRPMAFAAVELRHSNGHTFHASAMRHKTRTNAAGMFIMTGVRTGKYRVRAAHGHAHGHGFVRVHTD